MTTNDGKLLPSQRKWQLQRAEDRGKTIGVFKEQQRGRSVAQDENKEGECLRVEVMEVTGQRSQKSHSTWLAA